MGEATGGKELSLTAAAQRARRCEQTIRRWIGAGLVKSRRTAFGRVFVDRDSLDALLAGEWSQRKEKVTA